MVYLVMIGLFLLCGFKTVDAQSPHKTLFEAVSSTTPQEIELSQILGQMRKSGDTDLSQSTLSMLSERLGSYLKSFIGKGIHEGHMDSLILIDDIDGYLQRQYKYEVEGVENALKSLPSSVNARNEEGLTPLHMAIINNKPNDIIVPLMAAGADIYAIDNKGLTPEHYAAMQCRADTKLGVTLPAGNAEYTWGIKASPRSCWIQRALAIERRQSQGGLRRLYDWLERARHYIPELPNDEVIDALLEHWQE